jgi:hypothetical protein
MSMPIQMWGPPEEGGTEERISPERPEPQPMSRIREGVCRSRRERARSVISTWTFWMRERVAYRVSSGRDMVEFVGKILVTVGFPCVILISSIPPFLYNR